MCSILWKLAYWDMSRLKWILSRRRNANICIWKWSTDRCRVLCDGFWNIWNPRWMTFESKQQIIRLNGKNIVLLEQYSFDTFDIMWYHIKRQGDTLNKIKSIAFNQIPILKNNLVEISKRTAYLLLLQILFKLGSFVRVVSKFFGWFRTITTAIFGKDHIFEFFNFLFQIFALFFSIFSQSKRLNTFSRHQISLQLQKFHYKFEREKTKTNVKIKSSFLSIKCFNLRDCKQSNASHSS